MEDLERQAIISKGHEIGRLVSLERVFLNMNARGVNSKDVVLVGNNYPKSKRTESPKISYRPRYNLSSDSNVVVLSQYRNQYGKK